MESSRRRLRFWVRRVPAAFGSMPPPLVSSCPRRRASSTPCALRRPRLLMIIGRPAFTERDGSEERPLQQPQPPQFAAQALGHFGGAGRGAVEVLGCVLHREIAPALKGTVGARLGGHQFGGG